MRIEKINENQIRCTLTKEDLASRHLNLKDLAYGTRKTQDLFHDMIHQAYTEYGFETGDYPLMIEAIPMNQNCIVLVITKVEDPEELDTRFSRFSPSSFGVDDSDDSMEGSIGEASEGYLEDSIEDYSTNFTPASTKPNFQEVFDNTISETTGESCLMFSFSTIGSVMNFAKSAVDFPVDSALYKELSSDAYILSIKKGAADQEAFRKICTLAIEYGSILSGGISSDSYLAEHLEVLIDKDALKKLS